LSERGDIAMIEQAQWYRDLRRKHERDPKYWVEYLKLVFSEDVGRLMDEQGMNQTDLAGRLGTSRAYITRLFRGTFNPTVETLVKVALALDARVALHLHPRQTAAHWLEVPTASWSVTGQTDKSSAPSRAQIERTPVAHVVSEGEVSSGSTSAFAA
jgi:transcriptional regulator with XRE-family HTH domain